MSGVIRFVRSFPLASFRHVQNFERTPPDKDVWWMYVTHALVCGLSGSHAVCPLLMRSACCRYPVCTRLSRPSSRVRQVHFFDQVCFRPCPFFLVSGHFTLRLPLILFNLPQFIDANDQSPIKRPN